jgi:NADPH:quinone reductase-like Zn-dependent oxidoreductase
MKAVIATRYGGPDVLQVREVEKPTPQANEILIRIHATTATAAQGMMRTGRPYYGRLFTGLSKPKQAVPGTELAGEVEAVGAAVTRFKPGDRVFGATDLDGGTYAEYIALPEDDVLSTMPAGLSYAEAASIQDGTTTALYFLRDKAKIQPGQRVLINGASGSVGSAAVQVAKHFGAHVTGVASTRNLALVQSLGADEVIDYTQKDFTTDHQRYDIIFDTVGKSSFAQSKRALKPGGVFLTTVLSLGALTSTLTTSKLGNKRAIFAAAGLRPSEEKRRDLHLVKAMVEAGALQPVIDRAYSLD